MGDRASTFIDATPKTPCPVCGAKKWCTRARDGRTVICRRSATWGDRTGKYTQDRNGERWVYYLGTSSMPAAVEAPPAPCPDAAPVEVRDRVYRMLLDQLELAEDHLLAMTTAYPSGRSLPLEEVRRRGYRTLRRGRARVASELLRAFGADVLASVPGLYLHEPGESGASYWSIAGGSGMLVPVRDLGGRIAGLQVRLDECDDARYKWLSSSYHDGPAAEVAYHLPLQVRAAGRTVRITEGPLKADAATILDPEHILTIAFPGSATWRCVLPVLEKLDVRTVRIAFDADVATNRYVAHAFHDCVSELARLGYQRELELWETPKGIDDLFASGGRPDVTRDEEAA